MPAAQNPCPKRVAFVREIIQETMGFAPFEKRAMEVLKVGKEKRAQRYCKKRLGTHQRGVKVRLPRPFPPRNTARASGTRSARQAGPAQIAPRKAFAAVKWRTLDMCGCCGAEEGVLVGGHEKDAEVGTIHLLLCPGSFASGAKCCANRRHISRSLWDKLLAGVLRWALGQSGAGFRQRAGGSSGLSWLTLSPFAKDTPAAQTALCSFSSSTLAYPRNTRPRNLKAGCRAAPPLAENPPTPPPCRMRAHLRVNRPSPKP